MEIKNQPLKEHDQIGDEITLEYLGAEEINSMIKFNLTDANG